MKQEVWEQFKQEALDLIAQGKIEEAFFQFANNIGGNTP